MPHMSGAGAGAAAGALETHEVSSLSVVVVVEVVVVVVDTTGARPVSMAGWGRPAGTSSDWAVRRSEDAAHDDGWGVWTGAEAGAGATWAAVVCSWVPDGTPDARPGPEPEGGATDVLEAGTPADEAG